MENGNGWKEYEKLILTELERLVEGQEKLKESINQINIDIATLKTKASVWGAVMGVLAALATQFIIVLISK